MMPASPRGSSPGRGPIVKRTSQGTPARRPAKSRRASPDVVEKRRAARLFNDALLGEGARPGPVDGRTERRRRRLLQELADGVTQGSKRELKPIDVLSHVQELLELGEPLSSIRKACPRPRPVDPTPEVIEGLRRIHRAYTFPAAAYRFVGLDDEALRRAGVLPAADEPGRAPAPKTGPQPAIRRVPGRVSEDRPSSRRRRGAA
jgi:hypothetical protein